MKPGSRGLLLVATLAFVGGCASGTNGMRQATTNLAVTTTGGYRSLDIYDADKQASIRTRAAACIGAEPCLSALRKEQAAWLKTYTTIRKVLDGAQDTVELAADAADAIDRGLKSPKSPSVWVVELLAFIPKVIAALADIGLKAGLPVPINYGGGNPLPMPKGGASPPSTAPAVISAPSPPRVK